MQGIIRYDPDAPAQVQIDRWSPYSPARVRRSETVKA
jgi:hypothetical protein